MPSDGSVRTLLVLVCWSHTSFITGGFSLSPLRVLSHLLFSCFPTGPSTALKAEMINMEVLDYFFLALCTALQYCVPCTICNLSILNINKHIEPAFTLISVNSIGTAQNSSIAVNWITSKDLKCNWAYCNYRSWGPLEPQMLGTSRNCRYLHVLFGFTSYFPHVAISQTHFCFLSTPL